MYVLLLGGAGLNFDYYYFYYDNTLGILLENKSFFKYEVCSLASSSNYIK